MIDIPDSITTFGLIGMTAFTAIAGLFAMRRAGNAAPTSKTPQRVLILISAIGCSALYIYRWFGINSFHPVEAHVDGLLLTAALLGWAILYLDTRSHMNGVAVVASPLLFVIQLWAVCASVWTFEQFLVDSPLKSVHRVCVYGGSLFIALAAVGGVLYLIAQRRIATKQTKAASQRLPSLESSEKLIIRSSAIGFVLLTLGLVTGVVIITTNETTALGDGWWYSPKVLLAVTVWAIYALVTNVRHTTFFRGSRAAWLAICGLVLLLAVFGVVTGSARNQESGASSQETTQTSISLKTHAQRIREGRHGYGATVIATKQSASTDTNHQEGATCTS